MNILRFIPGYTEHVYDAGKEPLFVLFVSFPSRGCVRGACIRESD